jgi:hypothetical protein
MSLLLTLLGMVLVGTALAATSLARALRRRGHRCAVRTLQSCARCAAVLRGEDRGGHLVCACGAESEHLLGSDLLRWGSAHHGETLPRLPGEAQPTEAEAQGEAGPARSTTRGRAAAEAEERARLALAEELSETQRRMIDRARRRPDPITPQLLREAEEFGIRPPADPDRTPALDGTAKPADDPAET